MNLRNTKIMLIKVIKVIIIIIIIKNKNYNINNCDKINGNITIYTKY